MEEKWKDIIEYETLYQISDFGRVKSLERFRIGNYGALTKVKEKIMQPKLDKNGYHIIQLSKENKCKMFRISRLVAQAFIPNPDNKPEVNHLNGKEDNRAISLEWTTSSENKQHAFKTGLKSHSGEKNPRTKLTEDNVREIRKLYGKLSYPQIAKQFNTTEDAVYYIMNNLTWKHVI